MPITSGGTRKRGDREMTDRQLVYLHTDISEGRACSACAWIRPIPRFMDDEHEPSLHEARSSTNHVSINDGHSCRLALWKMVFDQPRTKLSLKHFAICGIDLRWSIVSVDQRILRNSGAFAHTPIYMLLAHPRADLASSLVHSRSTLFGNNWWIRILQTQLGIAM